MVNFYKFTNVKKGVFQSVQRFFYIMLHTYEDTSQIPSRLWSANNDCFKMSTMHVFQNVTNRLHTVLGFESLFTLFSLYIISLRNFFSSTWHGLWNQCFVNFLYLFRSSLRWNLFFKSSSTSLKYFCKIQVALEFWFQIMCYAHFS